MPFEFERLAIPDAVLIKPKLFRDDRGFFLETYDRKAFEAAGIRGDFVQDNHAFTARRGTLRGLHFQKGAAAQAKLVRCVRGKILDIAVDIRPGSATFGRFISAELSPESQNLLYVPRGFAHGYVTLTDDAEVLYKLDATYAPGSEGGLIWNDPDVAIPWPLKDPVLNERDRAWPRLKDLK